MQLKQGFNIVGTLSGSVQNQNNQNYFTIGLNQQSMDEFGSPVSTPFRIGCNTTNHQRLQQAINQYKGKVVSINVNARAVDGRNGAFLSLDAHQGTEISPIEPVAAKQAS